MSTLWVDLRVYQKDLADIRKGQPVVISAGHGIPDVSGRLSYVAAVVDETTRTTIARVVLPNPQGSWRPGVFVTGKITIQQINVPLLVDKQAVQTLEGKTCVFVKTNEGFKPRTVVLGRENTHSVEIKSGLKSGEHYVTEGAFDLKANIATSTMDSHAGHGH
jgi:cobalt-zinc-cadmium efflux system membrane fusion protein